MTGEYMRYAIVESGGKQYKAVEGQMIEVDRLVDASGDQIELRALLMADGDEYMIGTPTVGGIQVKATIVEHFRGEKVFRFKYSPKKRIRVRGGHRQHYSRLMVDFIGKPGETRTIEKVEPVEKPEPKSKVKKEKPEVVQDKSEAKKTERKSAAKKPNKAPASSSPKEKKPAVKKPSSTKKSTK
jgi:large subunit ribosomal protein L21